MEKFNAFLMKNVKEWQIVGFLFGWIFGHFGHDIALYNWVNKKVDEYHVVEHDSKWNPFD